MLTQGTKKESGFCMTVLQSRAGFTTMGLQGIEFCESPIKYV